MSVSSCGSAACRRFVASLLASLTAVAIVCGTATKSRAQAPDFPADRFSGTAFDMERSLYFWLNYTDGDSYGGANQHVRLGGTKYFSLDNGVVLVTGQGLVTVDGKGGASLGAVRRWLVTTNLLGDVVIGGGAHWDLTQSPLGNDYNQLVGNLELMTENWAVRLTGYAPVGETVNTLSNTVTGGSSGMPFFEGIFLFGGGQTIRTDEVAYGGVEVELARTIGGLFGNAVDNDAAEVYVGYYNLQGAVGEQGHGIKGGVRGYVLPSVAANVTVTNDNVFGTGVYGGFTWFFGGSGGNLPTSIEDKLTIPVYRNVQVATNEVDTIVGMGVVRLTRGGQPITFMHVNDSGLLGDGSIENPHGSLSDADADPNKANRDITYVHSNTAFFDQGYAAAPNQRVLGEGGGNYQQVFTDQLGWINIPQVNGLAVSRPIIRYPAGTGIVAANNSEISNFVISNTNTGIELNNLAGNVNVNRTAIGDGTTGIDILGGSGTFTFTEVSVRDPAGAAIHLDGGSSTVNFGGPDVPVDGFFGSSVVSQGGGGSAVLIEGGHSGEFNQRLGSAIFANSGDGLQFDNANGQYTFNGPVTLDGGDAGIDIIGGSAGTFTFANTVITNPTGTGINVDGGDADVTFVLGCSLTQANPATGINIQGGHTGQFTFSGLANITNGDGLQFDNADGTYNFDGTITLNGGDAGIDIINDSGGTFTFANTSITDPTGVGLNIDGGDADVTFQAPSSIIQNTYNQPLIDAMGGHTGTVTFELGTNLEATNGTGLQFVDADGEYIFNGDITLNGTSNSADTGIDIINDSAGTFTFAGTFADPIEITNDQGVAFNMDSSPGTATLDFFDIRQSVGVGIRANNSGAINIFAADIDNTNGDAINVTNTNLDVNLVGIGVGVGIGDDGIEVVNNDGTDRTATIINSNIFPLAGTGIGNRGIYINSSGTGTLTADVRFNQISATNQTIYTTSGPTASSLILDLQNSTLDTATPGVFTEEHVSGGLHSTIVRSWTSPNQVLGSVISGTAGGGILFDRVTFDADGDPGNGYQQVQYTGQLLIGSVPPSTITRVTGDGLSFINPTGDLSIDTLNIANFNGTGLEVDTKGLGTTFNLVTGGGTIDTVGGPTMFLDPPAPQLGPPPLTVDLTLTDVTSENSPQAGIIIDGVTGDINVTGTTTLLNYGAGPITVQNSPNLNCSWGNVITK